MNAIYARQSVDRADSISIESQIEFCQYEMRGEQYKVYTDRGYSGKNTDRPAFAEMMNDIESGVIRKVVVYKLDRISRSILDFSNMMSSSEHTRSSLCPQQRNSIHLPPWDVPCSTSALYSHSWNEKLFKSAWLTPTTLAVKRASIWAAEFRMDSG